MKKLKVENKKFNLKLHSEYNYIDISLYLDDLKEQKYIKKNTYSIIYHAMLKLVGTHISIAKGYRHININYGHIILLSYIMGFINGHCGSESFFGSNSTLANDIGVTSRTIQRWLRDLEDTGFIKTTLEFNTDRRIYVNFGIIVNKINKAVGIQIDNDKLEKACGLVAEAFVRFNLLERSKIEQYRNFLIQQCNIMYCIEEEINIKYLFSLMIDELDLKWKDVEAFYKPVNHHYIEKIANANG